MFVIIHDSIHNAVFASPFPTKLNAILADPPNAFPTAMGFRCYHVKHHSHLSSYDYDADVPSDWGQARRQRMVAQGALAVLLPRDAAHPHLPPEGNRADLGTVDLFQFRG